jgi:hypothetical protein
MIAIQRRTPSLAVVDSTDDAFRTAFSCRKNKRPDSADCHCAVWNGSLLERAMIQVSVARIVLRVDLLGVHAFVIAVVLAGIVVKWSR